MVGLGHRSTNLLLVWTTFCGFGENPGWGATEIVDEARCVASVPVTDPAQPHPAGARRAVPAPLVVATSLAAVEGVLLVLYGVVELAAVEGAKAVMGVSTALFFLVYAPPAGVLR